MDMRGLKNIKLKWHILLMIAAVLALSLGAWINFAQKTGSVLWGWLTGTAEIVEEEADPPENLIQPAIRMVDSEWTVWQEPELSKIDQTLTYFGIGREEFRDFLEKARPAGIDRIVPMGKSMDFALVWDGYDLIRQMSRRITIL
jgi:hypothetical protein